MNFLNRKSETAQQGQSDDHEATLSSTQPVAQGDDYRYMAHAIKLAKNGRYSAHPNPMVGCVIVNNNKIVGEGWHNKAGEAHAEINALKSAGKLSRCATLYVTLEPCCHHGKTPPCSKAVVKAGISRVVLATEDPNPLVNRGGISVLQEAGIQVTTGIGSAQAKQLNRGFFKRIRSGKPWVTLKIASSMDGKTAMSNGESQWISGDAARIDGHRLRAESSAVLTGIGTVLRDDPSMTARIDGTTRQPNRVVLDTHLSMPVDANILNGDGNVLILTSDCHETSPPDPLRKKAEIISLPLDSGKIDLHEVMLLLGKQQFNSVLIEAGSRLSGAMLNAGLVDEVVAYVAPDVLGSSARGMFDLPSIEQLSDKLQFEYKQVTRLGRDLKIVLTPTTKAAD